jgi:hypothetical protein
MQRPPCLWSISAFKSSHRFYLKLGAPPSLDQDLVSSNTCLGTSSFQVLTTLVYSRQYFFDIVLLLGLVTATFEGLVTGKQNGKVQRIGPSYIFLWRDHRVYAYAYPFAP